jgi:hypothetical protein
MTRLRAFGLHEGERAKGIILDKCFWKNQILSIRGEVSKVDTAFLSN